MNREVVMMLNKEVVIMVNKKVMVMTVLGETWTGGEASSNSNNNG